MLNMNVMDIGDTELLNNLLMEMQDSSVKCNMASCKIIILWKKRQTIKRTEEVQMYLPEHDAFEFVPSLHLVLLNITAFPPEHKLNIVCR